MEEDEKDDLRSKCESILWKIDETTKNKIGQLSRKDSMSLGIRALFGVWTLISFIDKSKSDFESIKDMIINMPAVEETPEVDKETEEWLNIQPQKPQEIRLIEPIPWNNNSNVVNNNKEETDKSDDDAEEVAVSG